MGSIVSFPVLCIANFAISRWALENATGRRASLANAPIGVNGDDLIMRGPIVKLRAAWSAIGQFSGLEESIGKTFLSRKFLNINSRTYIRTAPTPTEYASKKRGRTLSRDSYFHKTRFVNFGILNGKKRSVNTESGQSQIDQTDQRWNAAAISRALVDDAPERLRQQLFTTWIRKNKKALADTKLPWFIPEWLGGLGLPLEFGENKKDDLKVASYIIFNYKECLPQSLSSGASPWFIREQAMKHVPPTDLYRDQDAEPVRALERLVGDLSVSLLFDSNIRLADLYRDVAKNPFARALKHNRKLWDLSKYKNKLRSKGLVDTRMLSGTRGYPGLLVKPLRGLVWPQPSEKARTIKEASQRLAREDAITSVWLGIKARYDADLDAIYKEFGDVVDNTSKPTLETVLE
jgi:hypothetical protein